MAMTKRFPNEQDMESMIPIKNKIDALKRKHNKFFRPDNKELMIKLEPLIFELLSLKNSAGKYMLSYPYIAEEILNWKTSVLTNRVISSSNFRRNKIKVSSTSIKIKYEIQRINAEVDKYSNRTKYHINKKYKERIIPVVVKLLKTKIEDTDNYTYRYKDIAEVGGLNVYAIAKIAKHEGLSRTGSRGVK